MTLTQNAQEPLPTSAKLDEAHGLYADHPLMHEAIRQIRLAQHHASRLALLAEWSAGEETLDPDDFLPGNLYDAWLEATGEDGLAFEVLREAEQAVWRAIAKDALLSLGRQHRARLAAEREKWVAEVETLRGALESVGIGFIEGEGWYFTTVDGEEPSEDGSLLAALQATMALAPEVVAPQPPNKYEETLAAYRKVNSELTEEKATAEARVQRLEEVIDDAANDLTETFGEASDPTKPALVIRDYLRVALLPEETTK